VGRSKWDAGELTARSKAFFFEKKKQKTFIPKVASYAQALSQIRKSFWFFLSKKNVFLLLYQSALRVTHRLVGWMKSTYPLLHRRTAAWLVREGGFHPPNGLVEPLRVGLYAGWYYATISFV
jgi:hypothetical protein